MCGGSRGVARRLELMRDLEVAIEIEIRRWRMCLFLSG